MYMNWSALCNRQEGLSLADPRIGGKVAEMSPSFPHTSIDLGERVFALPQDGKIPGIPGWRWIHTPGHTEGHISFSMTWIGS